MKKAHGFTLTELAVVLVIVALLVGGLFTPLSTQVEQKRLTETQKALSEVREALMGYAVLHKRLPCPDTDAPGDPGYGEENVPCNAPVAEGFLPWRTLGVAETDAWGGPAHRWRYRVDPKFSTVFTLDSAASAALAVQDASGAGLTSAGEPPIAIVFSVGPDGVANGENSPLPFNSTYQGGEWSAGFDDLIIWFSRPALINQMVAAGQLP